MKSLWGTLFLMGMSVLLLGACKKNADDPATPKGEVKEVTVDASDYTQWKYFSFSKGGLVEVSNFKNDKSWDLALHRYDFRTNGGLSGTGKGGAYITSETDITKDVAKVDDANFAVDEMSVALMKFEHMQAGGMTYEEQPMSVVLSAKYQKDGDVFLYNAMKMPIKVKEHIPMIQMVSMQPLEVAVRPEVFLVRCADGKVARVKILDYANDKKKTGHIKFSYVYPAW